MAGKEYTIISIEAEPELSLEELCNACHIDPDFVYELIEYGTIEPKGISIETWRFDWGHLHRIQQVMRLQQDLEVNLAGATLAIDLMEQIKQLQAQVEWLDKHLFTATKLK